MTIRRREFLATVAGVGGAALLQPASSAAQAPPTRRFKYSKPVIDAHFHWYPPEFADLIEKKGAKYGVRDIVRNKNGELAVHDSRVPPLCAAGELPPRDVRTCRTCSRRWTLAA